jgi:hypothetical protein
MADSPDGGAAQRAEELLCREQELAADNAVTEQDVKRAAERSAEAHERDREAHLRERQRHYDAGVAHERAAEVEELAVHQGLGDVAAHQRAAEREREAARRDYVAAQEADHQEHS